MEPQPTSQKQPPKAKPPEPPTPHPNPGPYHYDWSKPVPVKVVRFDRAVSYPGSQPSEYAKTTPEKERIARPNGPTYDVHYLAPIRMFRISYTDKSRGRYEEGFVPEARSLGWEPVA